MAFSYVYARNGKITGYKGDRGPTPAESALWNQWNASNTQQRAAITRFLNSSPDQQMGLIANSNRNKDRI